MKFFKTLTLALAVAATSSAWAGEANSMNVEFAPGTDNAQLTGVVRGHDYDVYRFWAKKGQLLSLQTHGSDSQIQTALFFKGKANSTNATSQVLPYSGEYELRVMKNHADAMNNTARQYNVVLTIRNNTAPVKNQGSHQTHNHSDKNSIHYLCDGKGELRVKYSYLDGQYPKADVTYRGQKYNLKYDRNLSKNQTMVFINKSKTLVLDRSQTKDPHLAEVIAFNQMKNGNEEVVVQNCQPQ